MATVPSRKGRPSESAMRTAHPKARLSSAAVSSGALGQSNTVSSSPTALLASMPAIAPTTPRRWRTIRTPRAARDTLSLSWSTSSTRRASLPVTRANSTARGLGVTVASATNRPSVRETIFEATTRTSVGTRVTPARSSADRSNAASASPGWKMGRPGSASSRTSSPVISRALNSAPRFEGAGGASPGGGSRLSRHSPVMRSPVPAER